MDMLGSTTSLKLIALTFAGPVAFLAALPWISSQSDSVTYTAAGLAVVWGLTFSLVLAVKADKSSDEWQQRGTHFSYFWGWIAGADLVALIVAIPAFHDLLVRATAWGLGTTTGEVDRTLVVLSYIGGFVTVVLMQALCGLIFFVLWRWRTLGRSV